MAADEDSEWDAGRRAGDAEQQALLQQLPEDDDTAKPDGAQQPHLPRARFEDCSEPAVTDDEAGHDRKKAKRRHHRLEAADRSAHDLLADGRFLRSKSGRQCRRDTSPGGVDIRVVKDDDVDLVDLSVGGECPLGGVKVHHDQSAPESARDAFRVEKAAHGEPFYAARGREIDQAAGRESAPLRKLARE